jgi:hypothetical protein
VFDSPCLYFCVFLQRRSCRCRYVSRVPFLVSQCVARAIVSVPFVPAIASQSCSCVVSFFVLLFARCLTSVFPKLYLCSSAGGCLLVLYCTPLAQTCWGDAMTRGFKMQQGFCQHRQNRTAVVGKRQGSRHHLGSSVCYPCVSLIEFQE